MKSIQINTFNGFNNSFIQNLVWKYLNLLIKKKTIFYINNHHWFEIIWTNWIILKNEKKLTVAYIN